MQRTRRPSRVGSTLIELLVLSGLIAVMIALLIPVVLNHGDNTVAQKFAQKSAQKQTVLHRGSATIRTEKL